jgi:hypothetical protein
MRTQEVLDLEDLAIDEAPDMLAAMTIPQLRRYVDADEEDDKDADELGFRTLLENPYALSKSLRKQLQ